MLHGLCLRGYAPYAHGLRSGPTEWIIRRIAHKRKSANLLWYSKQWIIFSYHLLPIIHAYNAGTSRLRSHITAPVVDLDSGHTTWLGSDIAPRPSCLGNVDSTMTSRHSQVASATSSPVWLNSDITSRQRQHQYDSTATSHNGLIVDIYNDMISVTSRRVASLYQYYSQIYLVSGPMQVSRAASHLCDASKI
jgi:hypothetical protein